MKDVTLFAVFLAVVIPAAADGQSTDFTVAGGSYLYPSQGYFCYSCPPLLIEPYVSAASKVLEVINNPERRNQLAQEWLQFSKQSATLSLQTQKEWVQLQRQHLSIQREMEQLHLEKLKLQAEIEKLQVEKLRLEQENLQLRLKLQKQTGTKEKTE